MIPLYRSINEDYIWLYVEKNFRKRLNPVMQNQGWSRGGGGGSSLYRNTRAHTLQLQKNELPKSIWIVLGPEK